MPDAAPRLEPFTPQTDPEVIEDLRARLRATRWPDSPDDAGWSLGTDLADAFDVVVPDMPGYGYSDRPAGPPLNSIAVAGLWAELMSGLGYARFGAAGGDIGGHVSRYLGLDYPDRVVAVHRTDGGVAAYAGDPADLAPEERRAFFRPYRA